MNYLPRYLANLGIRRGIDTLSTYMFSVTKTDYAAAEMIGQEKHR